MKDRIDGLLTTTIALATLYVGMLIVNAPFEAVLLIMAGMVACSLLAAMMVRRDRAGPTLRIEEGCRLLKIGQIKEARVISCRTCGLARLTWPGDSVRCFYRDDVEARNGKEALDQMPKGGGVIVDRFRLYGEERYLVPDGHCFECGLPKADCRCDGL